MVQIKKYKKKSIDTHEYFYIYGKHVVHKAIDNSKVLPKKIWLHPKFSDERLLAKIRRSGCDILTLEDKYVPNGVPSDVNHQGVIALISYKSVLTPYNSYINNTEITNKTCFIVLSEIQDPQNVGAIIRSSAAFGVQAVLISKHKQAPINGTVAKVSSGMVFVLPVIEIGNINNTLIDLKDRNFTVYGLEHESKTTLYEAGLDGPCVFVVGNESNGLRIKTRDICDELLSIPIHPRCESLNASTAVVSSLTFWRYKNQ